MSAQRTYLLIGTLGVAVIGAWTGYSLVRHAPFTHAEIAGPAAVKTDGDKLHATVVTPHLECKIPPRKNVLWCATFQLAWNELCDTVGGSIESAAAPDLTRILNQRTVARQDLGDVNCVAVGGCTTDDANDVRVKIAAELGRQFKGAASPELLSRLDALPPGLPVGYAYLFADLPFEWAFDRMKTSLSFAGHEVEKFGIHQLLSRQENEVKAAGQVLIYDYKGSDDFIVELKTRSKDDRLILAKIPPARTLGETIAVVQNRLQQSQPDSMGEMIDLFIPVIDFDVLRDYQELCPPLILALQQTRFRLDESGAVLTSEAVVVAARVDTNLIFDKPFLVMIQCTEAGQPYFALWVANAELLVPFRGGGD